MFDLGGHGALTFALPFTGGVLVGHLTGNDWNSALLVGRWLRTHAMPRG